MADKFKKLRSNTITHLGDLSRYEGSKDSLLNANVYYFQVLEDSKFTSAFALNQISSVETTLFDKLGTKMSNQYALALYVLGIYSQDSFRGSSANLERFEDILGPKNLITKAVDIKEEHLLEIFVATYLCHKFPIKMLSMIAEFIAKIFDLMPKSLAKSKNQNGNSSSQSKTTPRNSPTPEPVSNIKTGFKVPKGGLALGFEQNRRVQANSPKHKPASKKETEPNPSLETSTKKSKAIDLLSDQQQEKLFTSLFLLVLLDRCFETKLQESLSDELLATCLENLKKIQQILEVTDKASTNVWSSDKQISAYAKSQFETVWVEIFDKKIQQNADNYFWFYDLYFKILVVVGRQDYSRKMEVSTIRNSLKTTISRFDFISAALPEKPQKTLPDPLAKSVSQMEISKTPNKPKSPLKKPTPTQKSKSMSHKNGPIGIGLGMGGLGLGLQGGGNKVKSNIREEIENAEKLKMQQKAMATGKENLAEVDLKNRKTKNGNSNSSSAEAQVEKEGKPGNKGLIQVNLDTIKSKEQENQDLRSKYLDLPNTIVLDTSILLSNLDFIRTCLIKSENLKNPLVVPSLAVDGLVAWGNHFFGMQVENFVQFFLVSKMVTPPVFVIRHQE